jgi:hypothetical protein
MMSNHEAGASVAGLAEVAGTYELRWRWQVAHSPERVWRAITTPEEASRWMTATVDIEPTVGGNFRCDWVGFLDNLHAVLAQRPLPDGAILDESIKSAVEAWKRDFDANVTPT